MLCLRRFDQFGEIFAGVSTCGEEQRNYVYLRRILSYEGRDSRRKIWLHELKKREFCAFGGVHAAKIGQDSVERQTPLRVARTVSEEKNGGHDGVGIANKSS